MEAHRSMGKELRELRKRKKKSEKSGEIEISLTLCGSLKNNDDYVVTLIVM